MSTKYSQIAFLGDGTYGNVYKVMDKKTNKLYAMKVFKVDGRESLGGVSASALREIALLKSLNHPNVLGLIEVIIHNSRMNIVLELGDCDLYSWMHSQRKKLSSDQIKHTMKQILTGLKYCHQHRVIHRDLKPQNIIVVGKNSEKPVIKIADFGLARTITYFEKRLTREVIALWYRSPEILLGATTYTISADLWSVGCIFAELSNGKPVFTAELEIALLHSIFNLVGTPNEKTWKDISKLSYWNKKFPKFEKNRFRKRIPNLSKNGYGLIRKMLVLNPKNRITAANALMHDYFQ